MDARPTLEDVARLAGVSKTTASLALRNHPKIPATTRARVHAAAEQMHYRPDPALSRIAAHRWRSRDHASESTVAFITTNHPRINQEVDPQTRLGAVQQGDRLGYRVEQFRIEEYSSAEQLGRVLYNRGIRGVMLGKIFPPDFIARFPWDLFACVGADVGYYMPPVNVVMPDFLHTTVRVWKETQAAGYRRIGLVFLKEPEAVDRLDKLSAALFCQTQLETKASVVPMLHCAIEERGEFRTWLRHHRPDAVVGFNDLVYSWLRETGAHVPADIGYASLMLTNGAAESGELSGMNTDFQSIGRIAVEQLDILLRTNQCGIPERPFIVEVPGVWRAGNTLQRATVAHSPVSAAAAAT